MKNLKQLSIYLLLICACVHTSKAQSTPDPGLPGTYAVTKAEYNLGDLAFSPPSFPVSVEVRGSVHYPSTLTGGPFPVLVFLHGRHETIFETANPSNSNLGWPPPSGWESITSYAGYDTLARLMASHGYIVISISCNAINATDNSTSDRGMNARGELLQHHLDLWNTWNSSATGPFGSLFVGKLDMNNIGTMGHSRGGEGVVFNAEYNRSLGSPYGIKAVLTLAPVDFYRHVLNGIPLMNIAPYCDGDVSNIQGVHFYDDARYNDTLDNTAKYSVLMMGANHNFYNTVWTPGSYPAGTADDWSDTYGSGDPQCGTFAGTNKRLTAPRQLAALNTYAAAFFRQYLGHETSFAPILTVKDIIPPISSRLDTSTVFVSYHPPKTDRLDLNRTDSTSRGITNNLADSVSTNGLLIGTICGGGLTMASCNISTSTTKEPHRGTGSVKGLANMNLKWDNATDYYQNNIPANAQDISSYAYLQYRAAVNYREYTSGPNLNYSIQLIDSAGNIASVPVANYTRSMFVQPGTASGVLPKIMFNTIKIPLTDFVGINLTKIRKVKFLFNRSSLGSIVVSDICFSEKIDLCRLNYASFNNDTSTGFSIPFYDSSAAETGDILSWNWNFGDPASGVNNSASIQNPTHTFTQNDTFNVCLYLESSKSSGIHCLDTFCKTVIIDDRCANLHLNFNADSVNTYDMSFTDNTISNSGDILSWRWNFGDTAVGAIDTSTLQNPLHSYAGPGTYHVCLHVTARNNHGFTCRDSLCQDIVAHEKVIQPNALEALNNLHIYVFPNPAHDYILVKGDVQATDKFSLVDPLGQLVLAGDLKETKISLTNNISTGMYYLQIQTNEGLFKQKILIVR